MNKIAIRVVVTLLTLCSFSVFSGARTFLTFVEAGGDTLVSSGGKDSPARLMVKGDSLRMEYRFSDAVAAYEAAIAAEKDSVAKVRMESSLVLGQNGKNMADFCSSPVVVARHLFSKKDFFLFYPLPDKCWRSIPNQLDSTDRPEGFVRATYAPSSAKSLMYSAKDESGIRNIYRTEFNDTLWTVPELINEQMTSSSDEIYPMLSPDGKTLFFASEGLYGMGGYDLYSSTWDEKTSDWSVPVNLGFPYSSPYNDFLFINTDDGKYSIFASDRDCPSDSVCLFVLEFDVMPVRKCVSDPEALRNLSRLLPANNPERMDNSSVSNSNMPESNDAKIYMSKMRLVRSLRDSLTAFGKAMDEDRAKLSSLSGDAKTSMEHSIVERELTMTAMQSSLDKSVQELQSIELGFLSNGVVIDASKVSDEADKEVIGASAGYTFAKRSLGEPIHLDMMKPEPEFDYSFKVLPEGRFAESNELPSGVVYQIQLFSIPSHASVKQIKGLSPVFERKNATGDYVYSVGLFHSYKDVLSNLNKVKRVGFRSAYIVAFLDGEQISVSKAREKEANVPVQ